MTDTVDLLEAIGRDASLRHASAETLTRMLEEADAPKALTAAVASGDRTWLSESFGHSRMETTQISLTPAHEEDDEDGDGEREGDDEPGSDQARAA